MCSSTLTFGAHKHFQWTFELSPHIDFPSWHSNIVQNTSKDALEFHKRSNSPFDATNVSLIYFLSTNTQAFTENYAVLRKYPLTIAPILNFEAGNKENKSNFKVRHKVLMGNIENPINERIWTGGVGAETSVVFKFLSGRNSGGKTMGSIPVLYNHNKTALSKQN